MCRRSKGVTGLGRRVVSKTSEVSFASRDQPSRLLLEVCEWGYCPVPAVDGRTGIPPLRTCHDGCENAQCRPRGFQKAPIVTLRKFRSARQTRFAPRFASHVRLMGASGPIWVCLSSCLESVMGSNPALLSETGLIGAEEWWRPACQGLPGRADLVDAAFMYEDDAAGRNALHGWPSERHAVGGRFPG
jgi:hypothetical protein